MSIKELRCYSCLGFFQHRQESRPLVFNKFKNKANTLMGALTAADALADIQFHFFIYNFYRLGGTVLFTPAAPRAFGIIFNLRLIIIAVAQRSGAHIVGAENAAAVPAAVAETNLRKF